jgi:hypothetical protein
MTEHARAGNKEETGWTEQLERESDENPPLRDTDSQGRPPLVLFALHGYTVEEAKQALRANSQHL